MAPITKFLSVAAAAIALAGTSVSAQGADPCSCTGGVVGGVCYGTLAQAVAAAPEGASVSIGGKVVVHEPAQFTKNLSFNGVTCGGSKASLSASMSQDQGAMLMVRGTGNGSKVAVGLNNIAFTREPGSGPAAAFHAGVIIGEDNSVDDYSNAETPVVDLSVSGCEFSGLSTKARGGSAIYIARPGTVRIAGSKFENNVVEKNGEHFGGGGALWMIEGNENSNVDIDATWINNEGKFEHSLGGAIMMEIIHGSVRIRGHFQGNKASDGGAVHINRVETDGSVDVNAVFDSNEAVEYGWGSRAGALRVQYVLGKVIQDGLYINNKSGGRGGVGATNRMYKNGVYIVRGKYQNNVANATGGIWDVLASYDFEQGATFTLDGSCVFQDNKSLLDNSASSLLSIAPLNVKLSEEQWTGQSITYAP